MLAIMLALATCLTGPAAADGEIIWNWNIKEWPSGTTVDSGGDRVPANRGDPPATLEGLLPILRTGIGPLSTTINVSHSGKVDLQARSIGAGVSVDARENPWSERSPPPDPKRRLATASVEASIVDSVRVLSPLAMLAAFGETNFITMDVRASPLTGRMATSLFSDPAAGIAQAHVKIEFFITEILPGSSPRVRYQRDFEKLIDSNDLSFQIYEGAPDVLGGRRFPLQNGREFSLYLRLMADVFTTGDPYPDVDPPLKSAFSKFAATLDFGGFFDFRDEQGNPLTDVTFESASGIDWLSPLGAPTVVPVPGSAALLAGALPLLALFARRRRVAAGPAA